jgi:hypothetical protein
VTDPAQLFRERVELALEIADECEAGEWVPWGTLRRYRSTKQRLDNFTEQANAARTGPVHGEPRAANAKPGHGRRTARLGSLQEVKHRDRREP